MQRPVAVGAAMLLLVTGCGLSRPRAEEPVRAVVISDLNSSYGSTHYAPEVSNVVRRIIREWRPDLVLIPGDMIAGQRASLTDENVRAMWAAFDSVVAAPLRAARIPLVFTLGNHDASGHPAHERDRRIAAEYWNDVAHDPGARRLPGGNYPRHYAVRHGELLIIVLDASTAGVWADTAQRRWLADLLASDAARRARLRIALAHVPLHAVADAGRNRAGEVQDEPDSLRVLLERGGVRMLITGHHHAYYPGRRGALELLHAGLLGEGPRPLVGSSAEPFKAVTLLELFLESDSVVERTYAAADDSLRYVDPRTLPERIEGVNGTVLRRDLGRR